MAEVKRSGGVNAAERIVYAPSTSGALAYAVEPAYRSTRLAAEPLRKEFPAVVPAPAPKPQKTAAVPKPTVRRVPLSQQFKANHTGTKAFLLLCVGLIALMGLMMLFNCKVVSDTQREINKTTEQINEMNLKIGEINMDYQCSLDKTVAGFAAQRANMTVNIVPGT